MVASGYLTDDEANRWRARPVTVRQRPDFFRTVAPYFAEHVRRDIIRRYGEKKLYEGGLDIETTLVPWIDVWPGRRTSTSRCASSTSARAGAARSRTSSGPAADEFRRRVAARYGGEPPAEGRLYLGLVEWASDDAGAYRVRVGGGVYPLPAANMLWAVPWSAKDAANDKKLESTVGVLRPGDVVWVKNAHQSKLRALLRLDLRQQERGAVAAGVRRDRARARRRSGHTPSSCCSSRRRACRGRSSATTTARATCSRWSAATTTTARSSTASRRPAASRARSTSRCTTRWRSIAATASPRCSTTCRAPRSIRSPARSGRRPTSTTPSTTR